MNQSSYARAVRKPDHRFTDLMSVRRTLCAVGAAWIVFVAALASAAAYADSPIVSIQGKGLPAGFTLADNPTFATFNTRFVPNLTVYADGDAGSDANPGTSAAPLKTLAAAQGLVRSDLSKAANQNIAVILRGTFYLPQTLTLTSADSPADGSFVLWISDPDKPASISGGQALSPSWNLLIPSLNLYEANVGGYAFRSLFVNGQQASRASLALGQQAQIPTSGNQIICSQCSFAAPTAPQTIEVMRDYRWYTLRCPATLNGNTITVVSTSAPATLTNWCMGWMQQVYNTSNPTDGEYLTAIENGLALTTQPGQWSVDPNTSNPGQRKLHYIPRAGENLVTATIIVPQQTTLISLQSVRNLAFVNLTFEHTDWENPSVYGFVQSQDDLMVDNTLIPAAFDCASCSNVLVMDSEFTDLGTSAVRIGPSSQNNLLFHNSIHDISGSGLRIGEAAGVAAGTADPTETSYTYVEDNDIGSVAQEFHGSVGIFQMYATYSRITHNHIHDLPYSAVSLGWGWSLTPTQNNHDNLVTANDIHDVDGVLTDGGGIYTLSYQSGTTLSYNYLYNILPGQQNLNGESRSYGVYLDNGSSQITVIHNCMAPVIATPHTFENQTSCPGNSCAQGNSYAQSDDCPSGTQAVAGVRPQAAAAMTYVRISDVYPVIMQLLTHKGT